MNLTAASSSRCSMVVACAVSLLVCRISAAAVTAQAGNDGRVSWTQFTDPFERAFTLAAPQGWTVHGGLFRMGYSDQRAMVNLRSPDGQIEIRIGDVSVPSYTPPNPLHPREGEVYDLGAQAQMVVSRYRTGPEYAVLYSHARFAKVCRNPQSPASAIDFSMPDYIPASNYEQSSPGQIAYTCQTDAGPRVMLTFVKTARSGQIWQVPTIVSLLAPPERAAEARGIAMHCVQSLQISPQWLRYQQQMDAQGMQYQQIRQQHRRDALSAQVQQFEAQMRASQAQVNAFERHQAQSASQVEGFTNALIGVTPTTDPLTGENRQVWTGTKDNYWVNGQGQVLNSTNAPGPGWRQLQTP